MTGQPSIQELVRLDLVAREQLGQQRYGTALFPHNGRNALRDAYEEAIDMTLYLKQCLVERGQLTLPTDEQPAPLPPEFRAARELTEDEQSWKLSEDFIAGDN